MMRKYRFLGRTVFFTALLSSVLILWSCSSVTTTSPTGSEEAWTEAAGDSQYAEAFINATEGGTLVMGENSIYFPPNALPYDTMVSIMREGLDPVFELYPDGIVFSVPVSLTLEMPSSSGGLARRTFVIPSIWYHNDSSNQWERVGGTSNWANRTVTADIQHFSRYGTGGPWWGGLGTP